jgi:ketosteroid isomerase-like protein
MTAADLEVVRAIYAAWKEGRSAGELIDEDLEYVNPPDAVEPGTHRGRKMLGRIRDVYDDFVAEPERIVDAGAGEVVVIARLSGRARASGVELEWRQGYVWTVRDGCAVRFRWFNDPADALAAVGIEGD